MKGTKMSEIDGSQLDYPEDAAQVRNIIREMLRSQVDHGSNMDGGGGFGEADFYATFGGREFVVTVKKTRELPLPTPSEKDKDDGR